MTKLQRVRPRRCGPLVLLFAGACSAPSGSCGDLEYPTTRKGEQVDVYHGVEVRDPYRWLEDLESDEVRSWVEAQSSTTLPFLASRPQRDRIAERLAELWNYERFSIPEVRGDRVFFRHNHGLDGQDSLYVVDEPEGEARLLLDPNELGEDAEEDTLEAYAPSVTGRYVAYALSKGGSDWRAWSVLDVETGEVVGEPVRKTADRTVGWTFDDSGFYYNRSEPARESAESSDLAPVSGVHFHRLGAPQQEDELILQEEEHGLVGRTTGDGRFLFVYAWNEEILWELHVMDLMAAPGERKLSPLVEGFDAAYACLGNRGDIFFVQTNLDASNWSIVAVDHRRPERENWRVVVPERDESILTAGLVGDRLIVTYLKDVVTEARVFGLDGAPQGAVELELGAVEGFGGSVGSETYYSLTGFTEPGRIASYDVETGRSTTFFEPSVAFDPDAFVSRQVFYRSKDGTRVPMFLSHRRGLERDGSNPVLLSGYGAYGISSTPYFSVVNVAWLEMGGVLAIPNVRGGGEYGDAWRWGGAGRNKQNAIDDMVAAAEWLCGEGYTSPARLALQGGSAGGLLVAACATQRPELFAAVVAVVPLTDMLRYDRGSDIGSTEFGYPDDEEDFRALHAYSPLHQVRPGTAYPSVLLIASEGDDRVLPWHAFKLAAAMQAAQSGDAPILLRVRRNAGHAGPRETKERIRAVAETQAFLFDALDFQPGWE
ncbi:MAG: prolyl oligopeptidase family serine peptidase [Planctomycetota bacterium]